MSDNANNSPVTVVIYSLIWREGMNASSLLHPWTIYCVFSKWQRGQATSTCTSFCISFLVAFVCIAKATWIGEGPLPGDICTFPGLTEQVCSSIAAGLGANEKCKHTGRIRFCSFGFLPPAWRQSIVSRPTTSDSTTRLSHGTGRRVFLAPRCGLWVFEYHLRMLAWCPFQ